MTTTREHLRQFHQTSAAHHVQMAKAHKQVAKAEGMDDAADAHNEMADAHTGMAEYHLECCKTLMGKAMVGGDDDGDLMPIDGISSVYKVDSHAVRAVPRTGQREIPDATAAVSPQFSELVKVDDGDAL